VDIFAKDSKSLSVHASQIRELAGQYNIGLADPLSHFQALAKSEGSIAKYMSGVNHPNLAGHQIIAGEIVKWLITQK
jgi:hypothetical protein